MKPLNLLVAENIPQNVTSANFDRHSNGLRVQSPTEYAAEVLSAMPSDVEIYYPDDRHAAYDCKKSGLTVYLDGKKMDEHPHSPTGVPILRPNAMKLQF